LAAKKRKRRKKIVGERRTQEMAPGWPRRLPPGMAKGKPPPASYGFIFEHFVTFCG
jgi:hypothetical protein